jgi:signal transduction histidine kinase
MRSEGSMPKPLIKRSLRSIMYSRIALCVLLCGLVASACVAIAAEVLYSRIFSEARQANIREAETRLTLFDLALSRAERDSLENGRRSLRELGRRYPAATRLARIDAVALKERARELGVSEIYFIDATGKVVVSTLVSDIGLDLAGVSERYKRFLDDLYGTGNIVDQSLSQSTLTGTVSSYQYFSPKGADFIIEVSTRLDDAIARSYPSLSYDGLVNMAFGSLEKRGPSSFARIVDFVSINGISSWSLFQRRVADSEYFPLIERARKGREAVRREGNKITTVKLIKLDGEGAPRAQTAFYAVFEYNLQAEIRFRLVSVAAALGACGLATALSFVAMKRSFDRGIAARIESLRTGIAKAAEGDYESSFEGYGDDEIGAIGESVGAMVRTMRDEEKRLSATARMETIGAMASGLAHDFNNVLTGIKGTIECMEISLEEKDSKAEDLRELMALASRTATRGENLVRSLFDLALPRAAEADPVDLSAIAREAAELSRGKGSSDVAIRVDVPETPVVVRGDGQAILRAVLNLCVNGIQAMTTMRAEGERRGGTLVVRTEARSSPGEGRDEAVIVVEDEGVGVAEEEKGKILAPFYSTKPRGIGSGIGLSVVLSVAASHGGRLEIESERGRGSAFTLVLPA